MTNNTPSPETINRMREELDAHRYEAVYRAANGMFYSARVEMDLCIVLSEKIGKELIQGV